MNAPSPRQIFAPSPRQRQVLRFIAAQTKEQGFGPTIREIGEHLGVTSTNCVSDFLRALRGKGLLTEPVGKARSLIITPRGWRSIAEEEPIGYEAARDGLLDAATEVASLTNGMDAQIFGQLSNALAALWKANDAWQVAQLRRAAR